MPIIQIPLQDPPPAEPVPEQGDLFESNAWESAYRETHDFPTLLIQARDDLARSRKREAFWMSVVFHIIAILLILNAPKIAKFFPQRAVMLVNPSQDDHKIFLTMPPDTQRVKAPPTDKISDKNRVAMSKQPELNRKQLKELLDAMKAGRKGPSAPAPQPQAPPVAAQAPTPQQQQPAPAPPPPQQARLQSPPVTKVPNFNTAPMSASQSIAQAAQAAAQNHGRYSSAGDNGDMGLGQRQPAAQGALEITSDTMGVDFGPYLQRVLHDVKQNWYSLIPESAMAPLLKKGVVSIEFVITKDGKVAGMHYVNGSGDVALDRAAYGGITASNPFPPLPGEFGGQYLGLRFTFYYNPDVTETGIR